ncbi:MAG: putative O-glycosylation ligase, exosortase A system-associated [Magnetococcales bacterium]|nr:putative O-glycosylation ligase, exosortase A system-associated [Magnetococcales bacterium]
MRDLALMLFVFGMLPSCYFNPRIGLLLWTWISYMLPHRLTWSYAFDFRFNLVIAAATLPGLFLSDKIRLHIPWTLVTKLWVLLMIWMTISMLDALNPALAYQEWTRTMKIQIMVAITIVLLNDRIWFNGLVWVIALSVGFYGVKGGIFTALTGGAFRVYGPIGGFYYDNNTLALALVTTFPLYWYLFLHSSGRLLKLVLAFIMVTTTLAVVSTYSRGGMVGSAALALGFWMRSPKRFRVILIMALVIPLVLSFMPQHWHDRMSTMRNAYEHQMEEAERERLASAFYLDGEEVFSPVKKRKSVLTFGIDNRVPTAIKEDYQIEVLGIKALKSDSSMYGRINSWGFAINVARERPFFGGGFSAFTRRNFHVYGPDPGETHDAHSIYFEVLAEQGVGGLILWLLFFMTALYNGQRIRRMVRQSPHLGLPWAGDLASMLQMGLVGYAACGIFLGMAYFDLPYHYVAILVALRYYVEQAQERGVVVQTPTLAPPPVNEFHSIFDPTPRSHSSAPP